MKVKYQFQIHVHGLPSDILSPSLIKGGGFLSSERPALDPFERIRKIYRQTRVRSGELTNSPTSVLTAATPLPLLIT
jgi:hypothetical protein